MQNILFYEKHLYRMLALRDFTMLCNNAEYKKMGEYLSLGQLYDVCNEIKIYTKHWLGLFIYYDKSHGDIFLTQTLSMCMLRSL